MRHKMLAPQTVLELVERFDRNRHAYKSDQYNEARIRIEFLIEFLNLLFEAPRWDINDKQGYTGTYKDVIHIDAIKRLIRLGQTDKATSRLYQ